MTMGKLREDVKEEMVAIRTETKQEFAKVRQENKITGDVVRQELQKMDERLQKLESRPKSKSNEENKDGADRDLQVVVSGWVEEVDETQIVERTRRFLVDNDLADKVEDVYCFRDPCNFGIIEFRSISAARGFLRKLKSAKNFETDEEAGRSLRFSPNRTIQQRGLKTNDWDKSSTNYTNMDMALPT